MRILAAAAAAAAPHAERAHSPTAKAGTLSVAKGEQHVELAVTLQRVLASEVMRSKLHAVLRAAHAEEGLEFAVALMDHQPTRFIFETFVVDQAPKQINLKSSIRAELLSRFAKGDIDDVDIFNRAEDEVLFDIRKSEGFARFIRTDPMAKDIITDSMALLGEYLLSSPSNVSKLIADAQHNDPDAVRKLRFVAMMGELDEARDKDLAVRKIISLFIDPGSKFEISSFSPSLHRALAAARWLAFEEARFTLVEEMSQSQSIMSFVRAQLELDPNRFLMDKSGSSSSLGLVDIVLNYLSVEANVKHLIVDLAKDEPLVKLLRVLGVLLEYEHETNATVRLVIGRKINSLFIQAGSQHEIETLDPALRSALLAEKFSQALPKLKDYAASTLAAAPAVSTAMRM